MLRRAAPGALVVLVVGLTGVSAFLLGRGERPPVEERATTNQVVVPVRTGTLDEAFPVTVSAELADPRHLFVRQGGLVTSLPVSAGQAVSQGDPVVGIDGVELVGMSSPEPVPSRLEAGDEGERVRWLQGLLVDLGHLPPGGVDGSFGPATARAVAELNHRLGLGSSLNEFDPTTVVWLPSSPFRVGAVDVEAGQAVTAGVAVATAVPALRAVVVDEPDDAPPPRGVRWELVIGDVTLPLDRAAGRISNPGHLSELQGLVSGDSPTAATVRRAEPPQVDLVSASAVIADPDGDWCVLAVGSEGVVSPVEVDVVGGSLGVAELADLGPVSEIVANPIGSGWDRGCG